MLTSARIALPRRSSLAASRAVTGTTGRTFASSSTTLQAAPPPKDIELEIDGKMITVPAGSALIQACEKAGATIPRFCYHDRLAIAGNCRMCLVEVTPGPPKPQASCALPAMPGQKVKTNSPLVQKAREGVMEFLLANHPLDCPVCDQGGECDLQDQSMRYGSDRTRFHEFTGKRAVEDKNLGPLVKTVMTRCIQCTRCVRFANEVAGVDEFGTTGRGDNMQIGTYVERTLNSEMSGNIVDLCPVGALTSKPYAFTARPWELKKTESVDVLDAVGSNIRIDSRGTQVMRIQPRINDDINEEWINDKTRYAYDGLKFQRLTHPLIKQGDRFIPATWPEALTVIANGLTRTGAEGNEIKAVVGQLADTESMVALKDFVNQLGSDNLTLDQPLGDKAPAHGVDIRSNYLFNSTLAGAEEADLVLLVGTNPRHEAATLNSRFRKSYLNKFQDFALIGENFDSIFEYEHLGQDLKAVQSFVAGKGKFAERFAKARNPMIVIGSAVTEHAEGHAIISALAKFVNSHKATMLTPEWNGFNVLQRAASRAAAYEIGFVPAAGADTVKPKFIYLLNADEFDPASIPSDAFVVYQGHHGDVGAEYADVCLPGSAYTEKGSIYVNTEGRAQIGRAAIPPPGSSRDDWKIIRALSEVIGQPLPYDDFVSLHNRLWDISPTLLRHGRLEAVSPAIASVGLAQIASAAAPKNTKGARTGPLKDIIENFYSTDPISRNSVTMARCTRAFVTKQTDLPDTSTPFPPLDAPINSGSAYPQL